MYRSKRRIGWGCEWLRPRYVCAANVLVSAVPWDPEAFRIDVHDLHNDDVPAEVSIGSNAAGEVTLLVDGVAQGLGGLKAADVWVVDVVARLDTPHGVRVDLSGLTEANGFDPTRLTQCTFITGSDTVDELTLPPIDAIVDGLDGDDVFILSSTAHTIEGGAGDDEVRSLVSGAVTVVAQTSEEDAATTVVSGDISFSTSGVETLTIRQESSEPTSTLVVDASAVTDAAVSFVVQGGMGDDEFLGGAGPDTFISSVGADTFDGGGGENNVVADFESDATAVFATTDDQELVASGDREFVATNVQLVFVNQFSTNINHGLTLDAAGVGFPIGFIVTANYNDADHTILTGDGDDRILTGGGFDFIETGGGRDYADAGDGDDIFSSPLDDRLVDELFGGLGFDILDGVLGIGDLLDSIELLPD